VLSKIPWDRVRFIAHNAIFDGGILEWKFGFKPARYLCTMMGSRPYVAPYTGSMSLDSVGRFLNLPMNKGDEVMNAKGLRRIDFSAEQMIRYGRYGCNDTEMAALIATRLDGWMPEDEQYLLDLTIKKFVRPRLLLDDQVIKHRIVDLRQKGEMIFGKAKVLGAGITILRSREKFANALRLYGVEPEYKTSKRTGQPTLAFAKDDEQMVDLLIHPDLRVRTLAEAKIFSSSTMETKRLERFQTLHDIDPLILGTRLPVPLLYYGAHTGRFSGYDKINLQNLTRVKRDKATGDVLAGHLRFALKAPPGYSIVAADLSNIEARIVATLAKCLHSVEAFRQNRDQYCEFASRIYGRLITKANEVERFVGKTCILGLGYGMGWVKFAMQMKIARVKMGDDMYKRIVYLYRDTYQEIPNLWGDLEQLAHFMIGSQGFKQFGPLTFTSERIMLPNGMSIIYPGIHISRTTGRLTFNAMRGKSKVAIPTSLWGGAITENVVQALAKIVISTAEVRLARAGLRTVLQVHDELVYCVPTEHVEIIKKAIAAVLCDKVPWLPDLPVACEIKHGPSYGDAK
jgi:DNA polymerase family A